MIKQLKTIDDFNKYAADIWLCVNYMWKSLDVKPEDIDPETIYKDISEGFLKPTECLLVDVTEVGKGINGFMYSKINKTNVIKRTCHVWYSYIKNNISKTVFDELIFETEQFGINNGCKKFSMTSFRNPKAWAKKMKHLKYIPTKYLMIFEKKLEDYHEVV